MFVCKWESLYTRLQIFHIEVWCIGEIHVYPVLQAKEIRKEVAYFLKFRGPWSNSCKLHVYHCFM